MRRLWIAIAIVLIVSGQVWAAKHSNEIADITYLLRCWPTGLTVADQSYINNQDINTSALGCLEGSLSATQTPLSSSNKFTVDSQWDGANAAVTRAIGRMVMATLYGVSGKGDVVFGLSASSNDDGYPYNHAYYGIMETSDDRLYFGASYILIPSLGSTAKCAFVLGGYNSSCVPYKDGDTKSNFGYGASYFIDNTLVWKDCSQSTSSLYMSLTRRGVYSFSADKIQIPSYDFSAVLQPTVLDTFTGADGTSLADHTPDVGGAWTDIDGNSTLFSNYFGIYGGDSAGRIKSGYIDTGISSQFISANIYVRRYDDSNRFKGGVKVRYQDSSNYFDVLHYGQSAGTRLSIVEYPAVVERAYWQNSSVIDEYYNGYKGTLPTNIINAPSYISMFVGTTASVTYSSSTLNDKTKVAIHVDKIGSVGSNGYIDNFAVWPLTSATYTSEFAKVGY